MIGGFVNLFIKAVNVHRARQGRETAPILERERERARARERERERESACRKVKRLPQEDTGYSAAPHVVPSNYCLASYHNTGTGDAALWGETPICLLCL